MVDVTPIVQATTAAAATPVTPAVAAIQVAIADLSQALASLTRSIQTSATPIAPPTVTPDGATVTLATALGNITVSLPQLSAAETQTLLQQLTTLAQTQKPLTLGLPAGSPPTQAMLLLPASISTPPVTPTQNTTVAPPQTLPLPAPPLTVGESLPAIVLSNLPTVPVPLSPLNTSGATTPAVTIPNLVLPNNVAPNAAPSAPPPPGGAPASVLPIVVAPGNAPDNAPAALASVLTQTAPLPEVPLAVPDAPALGLPMPMVNVTPQQQPAPLAAQEQNLAAPAPAPESATPATAAPAPSGSAVLTVPSAPAATQVPAGPIPAPAVAPPAPQIPAAPPQATPLPTTAPVANLAAPLPSTTQVTPLTLLLQPGNEITIRVDSVLPPGQPAPTTLAPNQIVATATGTGTDGQLILKAGDATLFVKAAAATPVGSTIVISVEAAKLPPLMTLPALDPITFSALPQAIAALAQVDPQALQQMIAMRLPQPTESLPGALLFLFSAFKQGDVRGWLGDSVAESLIHAGKMDLVASLSRELAGAGQSAQDGVVGEWKSYPIPLYAQAQFQALTLYVHGDRNARQDQQDGKPGTGKVRFLIDMRLSKLGDMQIDGFVQPKKIDMILRSEHTLPDGLHSELRDSYIRAIGAVGFAGSLHFQVGRGQWMTMQRRGTAVTT